MLYEGDCRILLVSGPCTRPEGHPGACASLSMLVPIAEDITRSGAIPIERLDD